MTQNAIELIKADHRKVEELYQQYQGLNGQASQRRTLMEQICQELTIHANIEEDIFYPSVQRHLGGAGASLVQEALKEHNEMKQKISQLQNAGAAQLDVNTLMQELMSGVMHHVQEEESRMLPQAEQQLRAELELLGKQMQQQKQHMQARMSSGGGQATQSASS